MSVSNKPLPLVTEEGQAFQLGGDSTRGSEKLSRSLTASVEQITSDGLIFIEFSEMINIEHASILETTLPQAISASVEPSSAEASASISSVLLDIKEITGIEVVLSVQFADPLSISQGERKDQLRLEFIDSSWIKSMNNEGRISIATGTTITAEVQK